MTELDATRLANRRPAVYEGGSPCSRIFAYGHTFRWAKGDRYIAVMRGTCVELRRTLIITDIFGKHPVIEGPQPLVDAIAVTHGDWADNASLRRHADTWAAGHGL